MAQLASGSEAFGMEAPTRNCGETGGLQGRATAGGNGTLEREPSGLRTINRADGRLREGGIDGNRCTAGNEGEEGEQVES